MKTVIVHGQSHRGSTYHIANLLADQIGGEKTEFFLPRDFGSFCCGCAKCFMVDETKCPHYDKLAPITQALDEADVIIDGFAFSRGAHGIRVFNLNNGKGAAEFIKKISEEYQVLYFTCQTAREFNQ